MSGLTSILNAYYSLFRKTVCVLFLVSAMGIVVQAQPFGNEWINYNQTYFKIKVVNDGIYRIPYATLNATIFWRHFFRDKFNLNSVDKFMIPCFK